MDLETLYIYSSPVKNAASLKTLVNLKKATFYCSTVDSLAFLAATPKLEVLNLTGRDHTFTDYRLLAGLTKLKELRLYMNPQASDASLACLKTLTNLKEFCAGGTKGVTTLSFLEKATQMTDLSMRESDDLTDITVLKKMTKLVALDLFGTKVENLNPLAETTTLESVTISKTRVADLSPLSNSSELARLYIDGIRKPL